MSDATEWHVREIGSVPLTPDDLILDALKNQFPLTLSVSPGIYHITINENGIESIMKTGNSEQVVLTFNKPLVP